MEIKTSNIQTSIYGICTHDPCFEAFFSLFFFLLTTSFEHSSSVIMHVDSILLQVTKGDSLKGLILR